MAEATKSIVRKGQIYHLKVANTDYRAFIWQVGKRFVGRIEDHAQVMECRGPSVAVVREQLHIALVAQMARGRRP